VAAANRRKPTGDNGDTAAATERAALRARLKEIDGGKLTRAELATVERWRRAEFERQRDAFLRALPKGVYCALAGRQHKVVDEFGGRYDIPIDGPTVDLFAAVNALHSRVSELAAAARPALEGDESDLLREKLKQEIGKLQRQSASLQIDLDTHMQKLLARVDVQNGLEWLAGQLRALGSRLYREAGPTAQDAVNDFLDTLAAELDGGKLRF
jgi:hypothetical protein